MLTPQRARRRLPALPRLAIRRRVRVEEPASAPEPGPGPVLVLSGGARMGAVQVGIVRALYATGFRPAAIIGTSAGAFNAAFLAFHPEDSDLSALRAAWQE